MALDWGLGMAGLLDLITFLLRFCLHNIEDCSADFYKIPLNFIYLFFDL